MALGVGWGWWWGGVSVCVWGGSIANAHGFQCVLVGLVTGTVLLGVVKVLVRCHMNACM